MLLLTIAVEADNYEFNSNNSYGLALFSNGSTSANIPTYDRWNNTLTNFIDEDLPIEGLGVNNDAEWIRVISNHEREEFILGVLTDSLNIYAEIFNGTDWSNSINLTTSTGTSINRRFDIAYEGHSGEGLVVYDDNTNDVSLFYRTWNGTDWSSEQTMSSGLATGQSRFIILTPKKNSDEIMLSVLDDNSDIFAALWNGTGFDASNSITNDATSFNTFNWDFAWEENSQEGLLVYGLNANETYYQIFNSSESWEPQTFLQETSGTNEISNIKLCSDPISDYIGIMAVDNGNDLNITIWNGTDLITSGQPLEDITLEPTAGAERLSVDCTWNSTGGAMFGFIDDDSTIDEAISYVTYDKISWSVSDLENSPTSSAIGINDNPLESLEFVENPVSDEVFALTITNDGGAATNTALRVIKYLSNSSWDSSFYQAAEDSWCVNNANCFSFDWYRYDPNPNVNSISFNQSSYNQNDIINFNVTISDNTVISDVLANVTLSNGSTSDLINLTDTNSDGVYKGLFSITDSNGVYTVQIIANDTSIHNNINDTESSIFGIGDIINPSPIIFIEPPNSTAVFPVGEVVQITVNITDDIQVDSTLANITLPNTSISEVILTNITNNNLSLTTVTFEFNYTTTDLLGSYTVLIIANDTSNNINSTESMTFGIGDLTLPEVFNLQPAPDTNFDNYTEIEIAANITDNLGVDSIYINVTLPNQTVVQDLRLENLTQQDYYNISFNITDLSGYYNVTFFANDTGNNFNSTERTNFTIGDFLEPLEITLNQPEDEFNTTSTAIDFNFTAFDDLSTSLSCQLRLNNNIEATNSTTLNGTLTNLQLTGLTDNLYEWNVTCLDNYANSNSSISRNLRIDTSHPVFGSLTTSPSTAADLDPGVNITVTANVTDLVVGVDTVILQYRTSSESTYTNLTMAYDSGTDYNAIFNATDTDTYFLRLFANDTLNNNNISAEINISIAAENTWDRTPDSLGVTVANLNENLSLGILTLNNTGDDTRTLTTSSDYSETYFNDTTNNVDIAYSNTYYLDVNASRSTSGTTEITLTTTADGSASPSNLTTSAILVVAQDQPVLVASFTNPLDESRTVTRGDTEVEFEADLNNTGTGNATNVTFFITVPEEWEITSSLGDNGNITNLALFENGDSESNQVTVTIPNNATTGTFDVIVNSTGLNESGSDLENLNLIFGDVITVTVASPPAELGTSIISASVSSASPSPTVSAAVGGVVVRAGRGETLYTTGFIEILRGEERNTPLTISNVYENSILKNIKLSIEGFLSQYITIESPKEIFRGIDLKLEPKKERMFYIKGLVYHTALLNFITDNKISLTISSNPVTIELSLNETKNIDLDSNGENDTAVTFKGLDEGGALVNLRDLKTSSYNNQLNFGEEINYTLNIFAPAYLIQENYNLTLKIEADISALDPNIAGFTTKQLVEFRTLLLMVEEVKKTELETSLKEALAAIQEMKNASFPIKKTQELLSQAQKLFDSGELKESEAIVEKILRARDNAFESNNLINEIQNKIVKIKDIYLSVPETEGILQLALIAFNSEDYNTALERAKEAQLNYLLETKGKINIFLFILIYWWALILGFIGLTISSILVYRRLVVKIIAQRLRNLTKEESIILDLMKEIQVKTFQKKEMSQSQYHKSALEFETRLDKIKTLRAKLRNKKASLIKTEKEVENLKGEYDEVVELLKEAQRNYFINKKITKEQFIREDKIDKERLIEIEEEEALLENELRRQQFSKKHIILRKISELMDYLENLFSKPKPYSKREKDNLITKAPKKIKKDSWLDYRINKLASTIILLEKFDLLHLLDRDQEIKPEPDIKPERKPEIKRLSEKDLKTRFPVAYEEIQKQESKEAKITKNIEMTPNKNDIENNIQKGIKLVFG